MMIMFIGTETLVTQLVQGLRVQALGLSLHTKRLQTQTVSDSGFGAGDWRAWGFGMYHLIAQSYQICSRNPLST